MLSRTREKFNQVFGPEGVFFKFLGRCILVGLWLILVLSAYWAVWLWLPHPVEDVGELIYQIGILMSGIPTLFIPTFLLWLRRSSDSTWQVWPVIFPFKSWRERLPSLAFALLYLSALVYLQVMSLSSIWSKTLTQYLRLGLGYGLVFGLTLGLMLAATVYWIQHRGREASTTDP